MRRRIRNDNIIIPYYIVSPFSNTAMNNYINNQGEEKKGNVKIANYPTLLKMGIVTVAQRCVSIEKSLNLLSSILTIY